MVGIYSALEKVYVKMPKSSNEFINFIVIFTLAHLNRLAFGKNLLKFNNKIQLEMADSRENKIREISGEFPGKFSRFP